MVKLKPELYTVDLMWKGNVATSFDAQVNPEDGKELRELLLHAMQQYRNEGDRFLKHYALRLRRTGTRPNKSNVLKTFTAAR